MVNGVRVHGRSSWVRRRPPRATRRNSGGGPEAAAEKGGRAGSYGDSLNGLKQWHLILRFLNRAKPGSSQGCASLGNDARAQNNRRSTSTET